jgi:hypothetical protein
MSGSTGGNLENSPRRRIHRFQNADPLNPKSKRCEEQRKDAKTHSIIEIVDPTWLGTSSSRAYGDAPWCSVINLQGDAYWNCQYRTAEECAPNVVAGDRGFCALNPWPGPSQIVPHKYEKRHTRY